MTGTLLGATFSWGCQRAVDLGISDKLEQYAKSEGKSHSEEEIQEELKKLASYLFYRVIALANGLDDAFALEVVKAHWIGNRLLDKVKPGHAGRVHREELGQDEDPLPSAFILKPVVDVPEGKGAHHNAYAKYAVHNKACGVILEEGYLWHLGSKRWPATSRDVAMLEKYGMA